MIRYWKLYPPSRASENRFFLKHDHFFLTATDFSNRSKLVEPVPSASSLPLHTHVRGTALHVPVPSQRGAVTGSGEGTAFQVARPHSAGRHSDKNSYNWRWNVKSNCLLVLLTLRFMCEASIMRHCAILAQSCARKVMRQKRKSPSIWRWSKFKPLRLASAWHRIRVRAWSDAISTHQLQLWCANRTYQYSAHASQGC